MHIHVASTCAEDVSLFQQSSHHNSMCSLIQFNL